MKRTTLILLSMLVASACRSQEQSVVNFAHLRHLMEEVTLDGQRVSIVHIYADAPDYRWVDASDEGITCVDDAARAAVLLLRRYELHRDTVALRDAKELLRFVMYMQSADGRFSNFLFPDHTVNRTGKTSFESFGWWAGRGVWALATGCRVLKESDPAFAAELRIRVQRSLVHVDTLLQRYGEKKRIGVFVEPEWLMYGSGADATSELLLGLVEYYRATGDTRVADQIRKIAQGMMVMQDGDARTFPYGAHRSWETMWHAWGNGQTQALAMAGKALGDSTMIRSGEREARGFYSRLLIDGLLREWDFSDPAKKSDFDQIAYGIRPMAVGLLRLYDATGNDEYLRMAGLAASWFFGNNPLDASMYDPETGRCFDGINDRTTVNRNSGAESTIEALMTLQEIEQYPLAMKYLRCRKVSRTDTNGVLEAHFESTGGEQLALSLDTKTGQLDVR